MLILASASPRRHELLLAAGIPHIVKPAGILEERLPGESSIAFIRRLAQEKAFATETAPNDVVLAADTVVCLDEEVFGKPKHDDEALQMLRALSGRWHTVLTGIALRHAGRIVSDHAQTRVLFAELDDNEIREYIRSGEPNDKAGAYGIQGIASRFIREIEGSYHNVVGLPVSLVYRHLKQICV